MSTKPTTEEMPRGQTVGQHIREIKSEYYKIDQEWLGLHYKITLGLVLFAWLIESAMGYMVMHSELMHTTVPRFLFKFNFVPTVCDVALVGLASLAMNSKQLSLKSKSYVISMVLASVCLVLFTVHNAFSATFFIFAIAITLTIIYASYQITIVTSIFSIVGMCLSEVFIKWDIDKTTIFQSTERLSDFLIAICTLIAFSAISMVAIRYERRKNEASIQLELERIRLEHRLEIDELTGVYNRKAMDRLLKGLVNSGTPHQFIFAMVDIDNFKAINDTLGHHIGDHCLIEFTKILKASSGRYTPFRFGGDEFCLVFQEVDMKQAIQYCEEIQRKLEAISIKNHGDIRMTVSFGLAHYQEDLDVNHLFVRADSALYEAKINKNAISVFQ